VIHPTPAIVTQAAVRRLPRNVLLLFCLAYILAGFVGRDAWKSADMITLGFMHELAQSSSLWGAPSLMGLAPENPALLPYWIGAWTLRWCPTFLAPDFAVRIPFMFLLATALTTTWYATYYLARSPLAQPVAFAFGGEARPEDYARAMADGALLAIIASLGLAQLSHETTPALAQLGFTGLIYFSIGALAYRQMLPLLCATLGILGLSLSGAPALSLLFAIGGAAIHGLDHAAGASSRKYWECAFVLLVAAVSALLAQAMGLWLWKIELPQMQWAPWSGFGQLLLWFTWPAWPLALWTLWRWRRQIWSSTISRHLALPLWFVVVTTLATLATGSSDRSLLLALPALATLAAFALPTLKRQVSALIDWFTLLFFSGCGFIIWVVWLAMQSGFPRQPAENVARLAPGFSPQFSLPLFAIALAASLLWSWLVRWRVGRHQTAIWKSLVLPAGGAALCWLLLMTLWLPLLNYSQSYTALVARTVGQIKPGECAETIGLGQGQIAAFEVYGHMNLRPASRVPRCSWLLAEPGPEMQVPAAVDTRYWKPVTAIRHPVDAGESVFVFKRR
jgi:hypothetical protein